MGGHSTTGQSTTGQSANGHWQSLLSHRGSTPGMVTGATVVGGAKG